MIQDIATHIPSSARSRGWSHLVRMKLEPEIPAATVAASHDVCLEKNGRVALYAIIVKRLARSTNSIVGIVRPIGSGPRRLANTATPLSPATPNCSLKTSTKVTRRRKSLVCGNLSHFLSPVTRTLLPAPGRADCLGRECRWNRQECSRQRRACRTRYPRIVPTAKQLYLMISRTNGDGQRSDSRAVTTEVSRYSEVTRRLPPSPDYRVKWGKEWNRSFRSSCAPETKHAARQFDGVHKRTHGSANQSGSTTEPDVAIRGQVHRHCKWANRRDCRIMERSRGTPAAG